MDLEMLIASDNPIIAVETREEERLEEIIQHVAWRLNLPLYTWDCNAGLGKFNQNSSLYNTSNPVAALTAVQEISSGIFFFKDLKYYLDQPKVQRTLKEITKKFTCQKTIVFLSNSLEFPYDIQEMLVTYPLPLPTKEQLRDLVNHFLAATPTVKNMLAPEDMNLILENLRGLTAFEAKRALSQAVVNDKLLDKKDISLIASFKKRIIEKDNLVEYISPDDNLGVVGGLSNLKQWIRSRKIAFTDNNKFNLPPPKGLLLIGVPGCGKTLCARAIAHEFGVGLIKFDSSKLYRKYIGESEENLRRVFKLAESLSPVVLLIDEVEKVLPSIDSSASDGGLSMRLFGTFLSWLQDKKSGIFVVATSNNISLLPPEFARKGRFDEIFFVDLPDLNERKAIFQIHLKRRKIDPKKINIDELAKLTNGFSGAEIEQLVLSSLYSVTSGSGIISTEIIKEELKKVIPLSVRESERINILRQWASTNTIRA
jgi:SpoVK/Ycf46/Vps4 family AAA+-type ATPase